MRNYQRLYTGKDTSVTLPSGERLDRAEENMSKLILDADKIRLESFKKNEEWFLKTQDVPIESFLNAANTETQARLVEEYNTLAQNILKARGGDFNNLNIQDKLELLKGRQHLESEQQRMLGDMEKYKMAKQLHEKDPNLDPVKFNKIMSETYYKTGKYPDIEAQIKSKNLGVYFNNNKAKGSEEFLPPEYRTLTGGKQEVRDRKYGSTIAQTKEFITQSIFNNRGLLEGASDEFNLLSESEKWKYLKDFDTDKSGVLDPAERSTIPVKESQEPTNPILRYAQDKYLELAREDRSSAWKNATTGSNASFNWNMGVGAGNNRNNNFLLKQDIPIQNLPEYKNWYDLQLGSVPTVTQKILSYRDARTGEVKTLNKAISFKIVGYSPDNDRLVLSVEEDVLPGKGEDRTKYLPKETKIEVDASLYDDLLKSKPYGFSREKAMGEFKKTQPTQKEDPWEKYKRK